MRKPIIGLNADLEKTRSYLPRFYLRAVREAGGIPLVLPPVGGRGEVRRQLELVDGLILTGADDYRPSLYGRRSRPEVKLVLREKEEHDLLLCREALRSTVPLFAICGGLQLLNIAFGGTLLVHVEGHRRRPHGIRVERGSRLARIVGREILRVNSFHHQAVDRPGRGLRPTAFSTDGLVEALEIGGGKRFLLAVQWHPERMRSESAARLFAALVGASRS